MKKRVLILGASGMIGQAVLKQLGEDDAWEAVPASHRSLPGYVRLPYENMDTAEKWAALLAQHNIQGVVNCVGIWSGSDAEFERIQHTVPLCLFEACERLGIRVVHVSALGFSPQSPLPYVHTKARTDLRFQAAYAHLGAVVQPSIVFGSTGRSSRFFMGLASLPVLVDFAYRENLQPVYVDDVARAVVSVLHGENAMPVVEVAGTHRISAVQYFRHLRCGMGFKPAWFTLHLPRWMGRVMFSCGEMLHSHFVNHQAWSLLEEGTCSARDFPDAQPYDTFATCADGLNVQHTCLYYFARVALAVLWLAMACATLFTWGQKDALLAWLAPGAGGGFPRWTGLRAIATGALAASIALDFAMGVLTIIKPCRWLWKAQFWLTCVYSAYQVVAAPLFVLASPFGIVVKNLCVMVTTLYLTLAEKKTRG
jgi:uncharacterized protein YbjT (DUF2867 family)